MWSQITNVTDGRHAIPRPRICNKVHCAVKMNHSISLTDGVTSCRSQSYIYRSNIKQLLYCVLFDRRWWRHRGGTASAKHFVYCLKICWRIKTRSVHGRDFYQRFIRTVQWWTNTSNSVYKAKLKLTFVDVSARNPSRWRYCNDVIGSRDVISDVTNRFCPATFLSINQSINQSSSGHLSATLHGVVGIVQGCWNCCSHSLLVVTKESPVF